MCLLSAGTEAAPKMAGQVSVGGQSAQWPNVDGEGSDA